MSLDSVGKLVAQHTSTTLPERKLHNAEREREIVRMMFRWITLGMILLGMGLVMMVAHKSFELGGLFKFLSALLSLAGIGVAAGGVLSAMNRGVSLSGKSSMDWISGSADTKSLPTRDVPSITERTTELLSTDERSENE